MNEEVDYQEIKIGRDLHIHVHVYTEPDPRIDKILTMLNQQTHGFIQLEKETKTMSADLNALTAEVRNNTDVVNSAITLVQGLSAALQAAGTDPVALQALVDQLNTNDTQLAQAVVANTPVAVAPAEVPPAEVPPAEVPPAEVPSV